MEMRVLTLRELNRATLARQILLERSSHSVTTALERLAGMQAQLASAPFVGLWTRLHHFQRDDLASALQDHRIVKATMMRATLHLVTASDYDWLRATLEPALAGASESIRERRGVELDLDEILRLARAYLAEPRTFAEITAHFSELFPETDIGSIRYSIRTHLPLVQVPISTGWSYPGNPQFTLADQWLGHAISAEADFRELVRRYLAAFGPARVTDLQTWSGLGKLKTALDALKPELVVYRDEQNVELLELPDLPLPDADTPAPIRFLPEFDNLLLAHTNRTRVVADAYRPKVYLPGLRVAATILVDGFVRGAWKVEKAKGAAALLIEPFAPISPADRAALEEEGEKLVRFVEPSAKSYAVRFAD